MLSPSSFFFCFQQYNSFSEQVYLPHYTFMCFCKLARKLYWIKDCKNVCDNSKLKYNLGLVPHCQKGLRVIPPNYDGRRIKNSEYIMLDYFYSKHKLIDSLYHTSCCDIPNKYCKL